MSDRETLFLVAVRRGRLCLRCASVKAEVAEHVLVDVIRHVQQSVDVFENVDDCDGCGRRTIVYRLR
jgi:hypothetical protein